MNRDAQDIIQEVRAEFDQLLDFVTGEEAHIATADHIERGLFKRLLHLGAQLLLLFFVVRAQQCSRESVVLTSGQELPYHSEKKRTYFSIFGQIPFWRSYFYHSDPPAALAAPATPRPKPQHKHIWATLGFPPKPWSTCGWRSGWRRDSTRAGRDAREWDG